MRHPLRRLAKHQDKSRKPHYELENYHSSNSGIRWLKQGVSGEVLFRNDEQYLAIWMPVAESPTY